MTNKLEDDLRYLLSRDEITHQKLGDIIAKHFPPTLDKMLADPETYAHQLAADLKVIVGQMEDVQAWAKLHKSNYLASSELLEILER